MTTNNLEKPYVLHYLIPTGDTLTHIKVPLILGWNGDETVPEGHDDEDDWIDFVSALRSYQMGMHQDRNHCTANGTLVDLKDLRVVVPA
jgi:hypothetical protein